MCHREARSQGGTFASATPAERKFDTTAQKPYLSFQTGFNDKYCGPQNATAHGPTQFVQYEDERSLIAKGTYSRNNGYGGVIIWTINQGRIPSGGALPPTALTQALKQGFLD